MDDNFKSELSSFGRGDIALLLLLALAFLLQLVYVEETYGNTSTFHLAETVVNRDLGQLGVIKLLASNNGILWIATQESISRYDGNSTFSYLKTKIGGGSTPSTDVTKIFEGAQGEIYVATEDEGLLIYDKFADQFRTYSPQTEFNMGRKDISSALIEETETIWLGHKSGIISATNINTNQSLSFQTEKNIRIAEIFKSELGTLFAASANGHIYRYGQDKKFEVVHEPEDCDFLLDHLEDISTIDDRRMLAGTRDNGLFGIDLQTKICRRMYLPTTSTSDSQNVYIHDILQEVVSGRAWISTDQGLYIAHNQEDIEHFNSKNSRLANDDVSAIAKDSNSLYWIATHGGLSTALDSQFDVFDPMIDMRLNSVMEIDSSIDGSIWIATYKGLLNYDNATGTLSDFDDIFPRANLTNKQIMSFATSSDSIWVGYRSTGAEHYSLSSGVLTKYGLTEGVRISSDAVSAILLLSSGNTLIGTYGSGLNLIDKEGDVKMFPELDNEPTTADRSILLLFEDSNGEIWVGTEGGLFSFEVESGKFSKLLINNIPSLNGVEPIVWSMAELISGELLLGTQHHGLYIWSDHGELSRSSLPERLDIGLAQESFAIYAIEVDDSNHVWLSTDHGLSLIKPESQEHYHFSENHGLQETEFEFSASYKDKKGRLYFGGSNGYNRFDPADIKQDTRPSDVIITDINIAGERPASPMLIRELEGIELTHEDYFVNFSFSVLDFLDPPNNQYRYKLVNFDPQWIESGTKNTATYTNLPAGLYTLRVQGANSEGIWNRDGVSLQVKVLPPYWSTWWAYCLYAALALFLGAVAKQYYLNSARKEEAIKAEQVANDATEKAVDDLHDQLDYQDELVKAAYQHNVNTLDLLRSCIRQEGKPGPEFITRRATVNDMNRVAALTSLEDCLFYQNDTLLANLHKYTETLLVKLISESDLSPEKIVTINEVSSRRLPVGVASPLAIVLFELLENVVKHAFTRDSPINYLQVEMQWPEHEGEPGTEMVLTVQDSGVGLPDDVTPDTVHGSGLAIVVELARRLDGKLEFSNKGGTQISLTLPDPLRIT